MLSRPAGVTGREPQPPQHFSEGTSHMTVTEFVVTNGGWCTLLAALLILAVILLVDLVVGSMRRWDPDYPIEVDRGDLVTPTDVLEQRDGGAR